MTKVQSTEPEIKNASAKLRELLALIDPQTQARQLNQLKSLTSDLSDMYRRALACERLLGQINDELKRQEEARSSGLLTRQNPQKERDLQDRLIAVKSCAGDLVIDVENLSEDLDASMHAFNEMKRFNEHCTKLRS